MKHEQGPCFNTFISLESWKKSPYLILNNLNRIFFKDCVSFICCSEYSYGIDMWLYISSHGRLSELINQSYHTGTVTNIIAFCRLPITLDAILGL